MKQNVSPLFHSVGLPKSCIVTTNDHTYEVDIQQPKNNWLYPAFRGFQNLAANVQTFATVGTGPGIDAIGAYYIFNPTKIIITDIHPDVITIAKNNFLTNISDANVTLESEIGSLCAPLRELNCLADVIYANLPNIPFDGTGDIASGQLTSTFVKDEIIAPCPNDFNRYLLGMQHAFLLDARDSLTTNGSVIINLGGRMPMTLIKKMFSQTGYTLHELYAMLKIQTQPEWVLGGYARAEAKHKILFDYYLYDQACKSLGKKLFSDNLTSEELKHLLRPFKITAVEALKRYVYNHERVAHVVQVLRGVKNTMPAKTRGPNNAPHWRLANARFQ